MWLLLCSVCNGETVRSGPDLTRGRHSCLAGCRSNVALNSPIRTIYGNYKRNASVAGREFDLTYDWFATAIKQECHYCGSSPIAYCKKPGSREGLMYNGIDRVDSSRGYTADNVVTCCKFCNLAKNRWDVQEFEAWLGRVRETD